MAVVNIGGDVKVFYLFVIYKFLLDAHRNTLVVVLFAQTALVNGRLVYVRNTPCHQDS